MELGTRLFRSLLLGLAGNRAAESFSRRYGMKLGASRFVAGETLESALEAIRDLNRSGIAVTMDVLGEGIVSEGEADAYRDAYIALAETLGETGTDAGLSVKPSAMGLGLNAASCLERVRSIAEAAGSRGLFVCLDMENTPYTTATIEITRSLRREGIRNLGTVIQAYLYRSRNDAERLTGDGIQLRLVKGAYKEPAALAYPKKEDVDANFKRLIKLRLDSGIYTAVATHDEAIIDWTKNYAERRRIPRHSFEFQMLYGIRPKLQASLAGEGYTLRCYVPYGERWYPYFIRRLAERPANTVFVLRSLIKRG